MSRYSDFYSEATYSNAGELWSSNVLRALRSPRGRKALTELREALLRLNNKRLITDRLYDGADVCAIGAYAVYKQIQEGTDPWEAFELLPREIEPLEETANIGTQYGLTKTLAWEVAYRNDETYGRQTPEQRYQTFLRWLDRELGSATL